MSRRDLILIGLILLTGPLSWVVGVVNWIPGEAEKDPVLFFAYIIPYLTLIICTAMLILSLVAACRNWLLKKLNPSAFKTKLWTLPICILGLFFIVISQSIASVDVTVELPDSKVLPPTRH
ncbi:hypothetical protein [Aquidulcibacter sp.]|uniref:hypothetical protein n=1 Tax=Aquidulcibacter sp. TaxID=2052990 RepID=UPI0025BE3720|nr:hypothetical protein [Aquidulcibacter sp.]MCA3696679.1 hypothetical protein [Aquidulcibacter sp.]